MRILGMDLGTWSIKAVEMESRFRRFEVLAFHEVRLPLQLLDATPAYKKAVEQLLARLPSHPEKIVTSLPPTQTALRFLPMPLKQRKQVEKMFRYELEDQVPFKLDDSIVEHHVTRFKEQSLVFAAIAPKHHIRSHLEWLKAIGLDPDWLTFDGMGVINRYLSTLSEVTESGVSHPTLLLDVGHTKTNITIIDQGRLEFFRSIPWGGWIITQAIASTFSLSPEEAEQRKSVGLDLERDEGLSQAEVELAECAAHAIVPLITDLNHSLVAYRNLYKNEVQQVVLTGGTSKLKGFVNFLGRALRLDVQPFHPFENLDLEKHKDVDEARFGETLGRAFVFARKADYLFNFRQQDVGKETSLTEVASILKDPNVVLLGRLGAVLVAILFVHLIVAGYLAQREATASVEELRKVFSQTFPAVPTKIRNTLTNSPDQLRKYIEQKNGELDKKIKLVSRDRTPMLTLVRDLSDAFPAKVKIDVNELKLDDHTFNIEGVLYSGDINEITLALKKVTSVRNVSLEQKGQRFTYKGEIVGR